MDYHDDDTWLVDADMVRFTADGDLDERCLYAPLILHLLEGSRGSMTEAQAAEGVELWEEIGLLLEKHRYSVSLSAMCGVLGELVQGLLDSGGFVPDVGAN